MTNNSIIGFSDSYKYSQWNQYPPGTKYVYSYIESRGGAYDNLVYFGLQMFLRKYLEKKILLTDIEYWEKVITRHGEPFNKEGWMHILTVHDGQLPVKIYSLPEGSIVKPNQVLLTIVNTDPKCYWLTSFLETALLQAIWYPTTVASNSFASKQVILDYLNKTGDPSLIDFKLHDFGFRGVSSRESAGIGGLAHLVNFLGTDTVEALEYAEKYYDESNAGFSIPAMEHSTVTSWGRENEVESFRNMLNTYGKKGSILAAVSDSYDIYNACVLWGTVLKDEVIASEATVVIRPDSGIPHEVVERCIRILDKYYGHTINSKGFKILNNVRIIQGDGITTANIEKILSALAIAGYSADNVAFGQGGALLQQVNRDTCKFAMKCSAAMINDEWVDVFKDPVTDQGKRSKRGRFDNVDIEENLRFKNGKRYNETTLKEVREKAKI